MCYNTKLKYQELLPERKRKKKTLKNKYVNLFFISSVSFFLCFHNLVKCLIFPKYISSAFIQALNGKLLKTKDKSTRRDIQKELRTLSKEERKRQQLAVIDVIKNADVVLTTLTGAFSYKLNTTSFDLVIIDEAAQALEITCWLALLKVQYYYSYLHIISSKTCICTCSETWV